MQRAEYPLAGLQVAPGEVASLHSLIRQRLIEHILAGQFLPGQRMPSLRVRAQRLGAAQNTALLAYQALIEEGHAVAMHTSGLYLNGSLGRPAHVELRIGGPARSAARTD